MVLPDLREAVELEDERGVSPVIGVILMVAITVILAAVIGTFVLGLGNNVGNNAQAGLSQVTSGSYTDSAPNTIQTVTYRLDSKSETTTKVTCSWSDADGSNEGSASSVGDTIQCKDGVSIIGHTEGGDKNVIREA